MPGQAEHHDVDRPAVLDERAERGGGAEQPLAEGDDHHQAVALGDVVAVPRRSRRPAGLGDHRAGELQSDQQARRRANIVSRHRRVGEQQQDPADLGDDQRCTTIPCEHARAGSGSCRPARSHCDHHRHPHDHVADDHQPELSRWSLVAVSEANISRQPEGQHQHADHLHHRGEPEDPVVGVVRRGEPREVDPRPANRERREAGSASDALADVVLGERVGQLVGGGAERDDEGQVEEQLQRRRGPAVLVRVAARPSGAPRAAASGMAEESREPSRLRPRRRGSRTGWSATRCRACGRRARGATPRP